MIECTKCGNETRTTHLETPQGEVMLAGTLSADPLPILAYVCTACGYIELYAPQPMSRPETAAQAEAPTETEMMRGTVPAASSEIEA
ncbi:MAG: hypothetical protein KatS3mg057_1131 [Herpetosiphonaceae bacterium]|nr:MAG: hypothetical protein KatS3mg057_1131 [Herpetosiphonaceae bacterium]